jgi:hypothetical protein
MSEIAKIQLSEHIATLIVPCVSEGFWSVKDTAQKLCDRNNQSSEVIRTFQNMITKIPEWSESTLTEEVKRITETSKCTYLDDLLLGVFLAYMKSFASLQYRGTSSQLKVEFERPNITKFIHELYKQSARKLWQSAFLFKTQGVPSEQQARNRQEIEQVICKTIDDVVRTFLPWEVIAKSYFTEPPVEEAPPPTNKSVVFEDVPSDSDSEDSEIDDLLPSLHLTEEDDKVSITELDEKPQEVIVPETIIDPLSEIDSKVEDSDLVLNL